MATIVIDPGHYGGYNTGICPNYFEGNTMLTLSQYLGASLTAMGANVKYTRTSNDQNPSLAERGQMAAGADLFISLHSDASDNPEIEGVTAFYSLRQPATEPFAADIGRAVSGAMNNTFRGTTTRESESSPGYDYLGVIRAAVAAGAKNAFLIEHGFHTNMQDCMTLSDSASLKRIAEAEAAIIGQHFGLSAVPATPTSCQFRYTVRPGDNLFLIGQLFNVPWQSIASENKIVSPYQIYIGQQLLIPALCRIYYTVQPGDTLFGIGTKLGVLWNSIVTANGLVYPYRIFPGQQLLIPVKP